MTNLTFTPIYTRLDLSPMPMVINGDRAVTVILNNALNASVFDDLDIPKFASDAIAIKRLKGRQAYQLIDSRVVKVTPRFTNILANFSKAYSFIRRAF